MPRQRGFTLIELLIVIAIIGILAVVVLTNVTASRERARVSAYKSAMQSVRTGLEMCTGSGSGAIVAGMRSAGERICNTTTETYPPISRCGARYVVTAGAAGQDNWTVTTDTDCGGCTLTCNVQGCAVAAEAGSGDCAM